MENSSFFGTCVCGVDLEPVLFIEKETDAKGLFTGRVRQAVDYLVCPCCGKRYVTDSSFDGPWRYPNNH